MTAGDSRGRWGTAGDYRGLSGTVGDGGAYPDTTALCDERCPQSSPSGPQPSAGRETSIHAVSPVSPSVPTVLTKDVKSSTPTSKTNGNTPTNTSRTPADPETEARRQRLLSQLRAGKTRAIEVAWQPDGSARIALGIPGATCELVVPAPRDH